MKTKTSRLFFALVTIVGLALPVFANLGLRKIIAENGTPAVGVAVLSAAQTVYVGNTDPVVIQNQLVAILNEAAATGNEQAIRYAIVAVMMAGGVENVGLSTAAINNSDVFNNYESLTAITVAAAQALLNTSGGANGTAGGGEQGGGGGKPAEQGGGNPEQGGGSGRMFFREFDPNDPFAPGNHDHPATEV